MKDKKKASELAYEHPEKVWIIKGTSDYKDTKLNRLAGAYAVKYNTLILEYLERHK